MLTTSQNGHGELRVPVAIDAAGGAPAERVAGVDALHLGQNWMME